MEKIIQSFLSKVNQRNQNEPEFMQAVTEVAETVIPHCATRYLLWTKYFDAHGIPERVVSFRVAWIDDQEEIQEPRVPHRDELGHWTLQGRVAFSPFS